MFKRGLSPQTQGNLELLSKLLLAKDYYLAGGTALSLHLGHRFSNDLDFFSQHPKNPFVLRSELANLGQLEILQNEEGTFNGILNNVKLSFFIYPYPLLFPTPKFNGINLADILDIACMKVDAISSRGTKRDFIDLYFVCQKDKSLQEILSLYTEKYSMAKFNKLHLLKNLVYFDDAEDDAMPKMVETINWAEVKKFFSEQTRKVTF